MTLAARARSFHTVMAGLVPANHAFARGTKNVDARDRPGHDDLPGFPYAQAGEAKKNPGVSARVSIVWHDLIGKPLHTFPDHADQTGLTAQAAGG